MTLWLLTARWCTVAGHLTILQLCSWSRQWYDYVHKVFCCCFCWSELRAALCCAVAVVGVAWATTAPPHQQQRRGGGAHTWTQTLQSRSRTSHLSLSTCHPSPSLRAVTVSRPPLAVCTIVTCHSPGWAPAAVCSSNLTQRWAVRSLVLEPSEHSLLWTDYKSFVWVLWSNILVTVSTLSQWRRGSWGPSSIVHNKLLHNYPTVKLWSC